MNFSISIVSHHSGPLIANLLGDLRRHWPDAAELIITVNTPEDERYLEAASDLPLVVIRNASPKGFGANHNQAFARSRGKYFIVVNPDIRLPEAPWTKLVQAFHEGVGACAPQVLSPRGEPEDSVRRFPTFTRLLRRVVLKQRAPDYQRTAANPAPLAVDWAAGMFVMFDARAYREVGGFDSRYFMYLEDVDICHRLQKRCLSVLWVPNCQVIHDAQRASRVSWKHRRWHARSALRFLTGF